MKHLKNVFSVVLTLVLLMVYGNVSVFAAKESEKSVVRHLETPVLGENNEVIGTKITDATIKTQVTEDGTTTIITERKTYRFSNNNEKYKRLFKEKVTSTKIRIDANGNYYLNDAKLSDDFLNTEMAVPSATTTSFAAPSTTSFSAAATYAVEDGGLYWLTYYTNFGNPPLDYFKTYSWEDANFFLDPVSQVIKLLSGYGLRLTCQILNYTQITLQMLVLI